MILIKILSVIGVLAVSVLCGAVLAEITIALQKREKGGNNNGDD